MHNNFILAADTINNIPRASNQNIKKQTHAIIEADICLIVTQMTAFKTNKQKTSNKQNNNKTPHI